jgi:hypothetical protein
MDGSTTSNHWPLCGLQKSFSDLDGLKEQPLFPLLRSDVLEGTIFPAIRKNEMNFYHAGGRLCTYKARGFFTNCSYLGDKRGKSRDIKISLEQGPDAAAGTYMRIKQNCKLHWEKKAGESRLIATLFHRFSAARDKVAIDTPILLDVEIRFPKLPNQMIEQTKLISFFFCRAG